jgi:hypothetical protein
MRGALPTRPVVKCMDSFIFTAAKIKLHVHLRACQTKVVIS